jgi:FkbM family methyltransferase
MTRRLRAQLFWGIYESAETNMIRRHLRHSNAVLELGAGVGVTAAHAASVMASGGRLICVEPNRSAWEALAVLLAQRTALADISFEPIRIAISDSDGLAAFEVGAQAETASLAAGHRSAPQGLMETTRLSTLVSALGLDSFALISDIEGAEISFILGPDRLALSRCNRMVIELHAGSWDGGRIEVADLLEALEQVHGFRILDRDGPVAALAR